MFLTFISSVYEFLVSLHLSGSSVLAMGRYSKSLGILCLNTFGSWKFCSVVIDFLLGFSSRKKHF